MFHKTYVLHPYFYISDWLYEIEQNTKQIENLNRNLMQ